MSKKKKKIKKSKSRFINPEDGSYRAVTQLHKSMKKYSRKIKNKNNGGETE